MQTRLRNSMARHVQYFFLCAILWCGEFISLSGMAWHGLFRMRGGNESIDAALCLVGAVSYGMMSRSCSMSITYVSNRQLPVW